ncbi:MAG: type IV-A pilus assembly ATPase PilB, partial [Francisellaceae bacterium]|nr:type IV-A pilus assembly ATPase PilB [Francisellaceae bacterium]
MLTGLAKNIVDSGIINEQQAADATDKSRKAKVSFVNYLVTNNIADPTQIALSASQEFGLPFFNLDTYDMQVASPKTNLKSKFLIENRVAPLLIRGGKLFIAVSDPTHVKALD